MCIVKLRFRACLLWTKGLTVETKLRFQFSPDGKLLWQRRRGFLTSRCSFPVVHSPQQTPGKKEYLLAGKDAQGMKKRQCKLLVTFFLCDFII